MANVNVPYADPGRASFEVLDTHLQNFLLSGTHPELAPAYGFPLPNSVSYAQFTVVGLNGSGQLVPAVLGTTPAIGILAHAASLGATGAGNGQVFYSGCFNPAALIWGASYDTDAKKEAAFRGAATPTNIIIRKRG